MFKKIESTQTVSSPSNYVFVVDVSGSMYHTLTQLRTHLKNKFTTLLKAGDKLSIVYFSGRNDAGFVFEDVEINTTSDLTNVKNGIDRWLQPIGLTAFCKPLELALTKVDPNFLNGMIFMTDGYNNDCNRETIFKSMVQVRDSFDSVTMIEYGYYADTNMIAEMASLADGTVIASADFLDMALHVESELTKLNAPRVQVGIDNAEYAVGFSDGVLTLYYPTDGNVYVSGNTKWIVYGTPETELELLTLTWGAFVFGNIDECEQHLFTLGDIGLIERFVRAYGKQKALEFKNEVLFTIDGTRTLYADGKVDNYTVDPNAYTVMDMLGQLSTGDNKVYINHPEFNYNRIGRKAVRTEVDTELLQEVTAITGSSLTASELVGGAQPVFEATNPKGGAEINSLTWNTERANVSLTVTTPGTVTNLGPNQWGVTEWESKITRSYNIIKDGILNVTRIVCSLDEPTRAEFEKHSLIVGEEMYGEAKVYIVDFSYLGVINRASLAKLNAVETAKAYFELQMQKAAAKVFKFFSKDESEPETSDEQKTAWLETMGIKPYGFNPKVTLSESVDFYMAPVLKAKIKGLSSLPSVDAVVKKQEAKKSLTLSEQVIAKYIDLYLKLADKDEKILTATTDAVVKQKRKLERGIANNVMSIILGRTWFNDLDGYDDNVVTFTHPEFGEITVTYDYDDVEVKI